MFILDASVRVFWDEMNTEWIDWVEQIALPNVEGLQPISWMSKLNKRTEPTPSENILTASKLGYWLFSCLRTQIKTLALLESQVCRFWGGDYAINFLGFPAFWLTLQILGLAGLHSHMSQFLIINPYMHIYLYIGSVSLKSPDPILCYRTPAIKSSHLKWTKWLVTDRKKELHP